MVIKKSFLCSVLFLLLFFGANSARAERGKGLSTYLAAGINYSFPGAIRVGWNEWEYGMINMIMVGADKVFPISKSTYATFGIGAGGPGGTIGFAASLGYDADLFWGLRFRSELVADGFLDGYNAAFGLVGLGYDF